LEHGYATSSIDKRAASELQFRGAFATIESVGLSKSLHGEWTRATGKIQHTNRSNPRVSCASHFHGVVSKRGRASFKRRIFVYYDGVTETGV
jgi:hypothetical protein